VYAKSYLAMIRAAPTALGWLYDALDKPFANERFARLMNKLNTSRFEKMLRQAKPDLAICTHFLPAEIISRLKEKKVLRCPQAVVVTDFDAHAMWLVRRYEHYFVALDETRAHLEKHGVKRDAISVSGIPIDPVFTASKGSRAMRLKHGLMPDRPTILLSAGGFGVGPVEKLMAALLELEHAAQVVAVCGKNAKLKASLEAQAARAGGSRVAVKVLGYTHDMDELMSASDLIVGKPGGLTTSEALAKGLAFVIVNPIPGQEERNSDHLLEAGVAIRCNNPPTIAYKIDRLLGDAPRLAAMRAAARKFAHPDSAGRIVEELERLM
jgi:processive 1,2-diacylglycerol beta-glucosyltransferase